MKSIHVLAGGALLTMTMTMACGGSGEATGSSSGAMTVRGTVSPSSRTLDNARVLAIASSGKTYWAYLDAKGAFAVNVPAGHAYRILVANQTTSGDLRTIGHLAIQTSHGTTTWLGARSAGSVNLGTLQVAGTSATGTLGALDESHGDLGGSSADDRDDDHHDDVDSHEDDDEGKRVCKGEKDDENEKDDDCELRAEHGRDPGDECDDRHLDDDQEKDDEDHKIDRACGAGAGSGASSSGAGASSSGATPPPPPPPTAPPSTTGTVSVGGACSVNADCAGVSVACVGSVCTVVVR